MSKLSSPIYTGKEKLIIFLKAGASVLAFYAFAIITVLLAQILNFG